MKVSNPKTPSTREIPEAPAEARWADRLLEQRDQHIKDITRALQGQLSLADNLNAEVRDLSILDDTEVTVELKKIRGAPIGALLLWTERKERGDFWWAPVDVGKALFSVSWPSLPEGEQKVRVVFFGS